MLNKKMLNRFHISFGIVSLCLVTTPVCANASLQMATQSSLSASAADPASISLLEQGSTLHYSGYFQEAIATSDDNPFANQLFSSNLFRQIPITCEANQLGRFCSYRKRYIFRDIVLVIEEKISDNITLTLTPVEPVSVEQALSYAKILTSSERINYDSPSNQTSNRIIYRGCRLGNSDYYLCTTTVTLNSDRQVIEIVYVSHTE